MTEADIQKMEAELMNDPAVSENVKNAFQTLVQHIRNISCKKSCKHGGCKSKMKSSDDTVIDAEPFKE